MTDSVEVFAVVGAGSIGVAFAIVFARAGFTVRLYDPHAPRRDAALGEISGRLTDLRRSGLLDQTPDTVAGRVVIDADLGAAVAAADYVQECAPEELEVKCRLFADLDALTPSSSPLASSSSAITASAFANGLSGRGRCLVAHPGNPPYLIAPIEVVAAPFTDALAVERAAALLRRAGLAPILVGKEVEGFVFNRLQGALLREAYCLVRDGVASVDDVDRLVRDGLGLRWSVVGPFETADLNTRGGIAVHAERLGPAYARMGQERGQDDPWTPDLVERVVAARRAQLPLADWDKRVAWRDRQMMALLRCRSDAKH